MDNESSFCISIELLCMHHVYEKHITSEGRQLHPHTYFMTKAETHSLAVAAASIIARASFVKEMEDLSKIVGFSLLKGASLKVDQQIAKIIRTKGKQFLPSVAKVHFANTKKAEKLV